MLDRLYKELNTCKRIGLFDSGVGGLTVLDKLKHLSLKSNGISSADGLPERQFIYLGDSARCPYGNRTPAEIVTFVTEITGWLKGKGVDGIVVACNTSASLALETTRQIAEMPVIDLINPTADYVAKIGRKVGIMATKATSRSRAFSTAIQELAADIPVVEIACPDLVPIIEAGEIQNLQTTAVLQKYAEILVQQKIEVLIWGCTHFPFLQNVFKPLVPDHLIFVDPAQVLCGYLEGEGAKVLPDKAQAPCEIFVTGDPTEFARTARTCLGYLPGTISGITIDEVISPMITEKINYKQSAKTEGSPFAPAV